jgi:hypothetical protein
MRIPSSNLLKYKYNVIQLSLQAIFRLLCQQVYVIATQCTGTYNAFSGGHEMGALKRPQ